MENITNLRIFSKEYICSLLDREHIAGFVSQWTFSSNVRRTYDRFKPLLWLLIFLECLVPVCVYFAAPNLYEVTQFCSSFTSFCFSAVTASPIYDTNKCCQHYRIKPIFLRLSALQKNTRQISQHKTSLLQQTHRKIMSRGWISSGLYQSFMNSHTISTY